MAVPDYLLLQGDSSLELRFKPTCADTPIWLDTGCGYEGVTVYLSPEHATELRDWLDQALKEPR